MTTKYQTDIKRSFFELVANDITAEDRRPNVWAVEERLDPHTEVQVTAISEGLE